jgi:hypothetical protein
MRDDTDILDDMIPRATVEEGEPPLLLAVGQRCLNNIEMAIKDYACRAEPQLGLPIPFLECENPDDDPSEAVLQCYATDRAGNRVLLPEYQEWFGREPTVREVIDLTMELCALKHEKYIPHLEIARSLGKTDLRGRPNLDDYIAACRAAGIEPLEGLKL